MFFSPPKLRLFLIIYQKTDNCNQLSVLILKFYQITLIIPIIIIITSNKRTITVITGCCSSFLWTFGMKLSQYHLGWKTFKIIDPTHIIINNNFPTSDKISIMCPPCTTVRCLFILIHQYLIILYHIYIKSSIIYLSMPDIFVIFRYLHFNYITYNHW